MSLSDTFVKLLLKLTALAFLFMILASWTFGSIATFNSIRIIESYGDALNNSEEQLKISKIKNALGMNTKDYKVTVIDGVANFEEKVPYNFRLAGAMQDTKWLLNRELTKVKDKNLVYKQPNG